MGVCAYAVVAIASAAVTTRIRFIISLSYV
jgi:hypothetical protein